MTVKSLLYESKSNQITIKPPMLNHKAKLMCVRWTKTSLISPQQSHWRASSHPQTERYERDSDLCVHIDLCFVSNRFISAWRQHTCWEQLTHTYNWPTQTGFLTTQCNALDVACSFVSIALLKSISTITITEGSVFKLSMCIILQHLSSKHEWFHKLCDFYWRRDPGHIYRPQTPKTP